MYYREGHISIHDILVMALVQVQYLKITEFKDIIKLAVCAVQVTYIPSYLVRDTLIDYKSTLLPTNLLQGYHLSSLKM